VTILYPDNACGLNKKHPNFLFKVIENVIYYENIYKKSKKIRINFQTFALIIRNNSAFKLNT